MIKGKTKSGFEFELADSIGDDYEVFECIAALRNDEDVFMLTKLVNLALGAEQRESFKEHCRGEDGRISTERMMREFFEILSSADATKK